MKYVTSTLITAGLLTVAVQSHPLAPRPELSRLALSSQASLVVSQTMPGECCNDDFRQALPLLDTPVDTVIAKP